MDISHLRCFVAVAEELHFGRAAERLHLTPSPVSRAVKELETESGGPLFIREYHSVALTHRGQQLLGPARDVVAEFDSLAHRIKDMTNQTVRPVRLGATPLVIPSTIDGVLESIAHAGYDVDPELEMAFSVSLFKQIQLGDIDVAIVHLPADIPGIDSMRISDYEFMVVMRSDDELADREVLSLSDLTDRLFLAGGLAPHPATMTRMYDQLRAGGLNNIRVMPDNDPVGISSIIRRQGAVSLTNRGAVALSTIYSTDEFAIVPLESGTLDVQVGLAWRASDYANEKSIEAIVNAVRTMVDAVEVGTLRV